MKRTDVEHRVRQFAWPTPSAGLRDRVVSAAAVPQHTITWSDRMWFSRTWRLSALAAIVLLGALEYLAGLPRSAELALSPQVLADAAVIGETGRELGLSSDAADALVRRALTEASRPRTFDQGRTLQDFVPEGERR